MTRCILLDEWFNAQSKRLDQEEKRTGKDLVAGGKRES